MAGLPEKFWPIPSLLAKSEQGKSRLNKTVPINYGAARETSFRCCTGVEGGGLGGAYATCPLRLSRGAQQVALVGALKKTGLGGVLILV